MSEGGKSEYVDILYWYWDLLCLQASPGGKDDVVKKAQGLFKSIPIVGHYRYDASVGPRLRSPVDMHFCLSGIPKHQDLGQHSAVMVAVGSSHDYVQHLAERWPIGLVYLDQLFQRLETHNR